MIWQFLYNPRLGLKRMDLFEGSILLFVLDIRKAKRYLERTFHVIYEGGRNDRMWVQTPDGLTGLILKEVPSELQDREDDTLPSEADQGTG